MRVPHPLTTALLLLLAGCQRHQEAVEIMGTLERDRLELVAEAHEPIAQILAHEGDSVSAGQVILRQELGAVQTQLDQLHASVAQAEHRLQELVHGPRAPEVLEARAALESADSAFSTASSEYQRAQALVERKLASPSTLDQARAQRDTASGTRKQASAQLRLLLEGTRIEELDQARAALAAVQANLAQTELSATRLTVTAPRAGRIEAFPYKLGERPPAGAPVVIMLADSVPYARVYVPEPWRTRMLPGTRVGVHIDGEPAALVGVVRFVSAQAAFTPYFALTERDRSRLSYLAEIDLTEDSARVVPSGIPVQVSLAAVQDHPQ